MNTKQKLLDLFHRHNNRLTLGELLSDPSGIGYKCTSRFSDLRKDGYVINCEKGPTASQNTYTLIDYDQKGQGLII